MLTKYFSNEKNSLSFPLSELHANDEGFGENRMTSIRTIAMSISHFYLTGNLKNGILISQDCVTVSVSQNDHMMSSHENINSFKIGTQMWSFQNIYVKMFFKNIQC